MINLAPHTAIMVYLMIISTALSITWYLTSRRQKQRVILKPRQKLHTCEFCHMSFLKDTTRPVSKCPQCDSYV